MLSPAAFAEHKEAICRSGPLSAGHDLLGMEIDFQHALGDSVYADQPHELWGEPIVQQTEHGDWLISASATAKPGVTTEQIETALSNAWTRDLCYQYREAHTLLTEPTSVTLQAVTQIGPNDLWVTAQVRIALPVPPT